MKVIYIAGPFRANTAWEIEKNIRVAEELSLRVWLAGSVALCPHTNTRFFHGESTEQMWVDGTLELMRRCDAVLLTSPDAPEHSSGTKGEVEEMKKLGRPVFNTFEEYVKWLKENN